MYYTAGRELIFNDSSPYSDAVAQQNQLAILKRLAKPGEDQMAFSYPLYAMLPVFPTLRMPFDWAQPFWLSFNLIALSSALFIAFPKRPLRGLLFALPFYPLVFGLVLGNLNILVFTIIIAALGLLVFQKQRGTSIQIILGFLLAWLTIKPQFSWFYLIFFALYALREKLKALMGSFFAGLLIYAAISTMIWPTWFPEWLVRLKAYTTYIPSEPVLLLILKRFFPEQTVAFFTILIALIFLGISMYIFIQWWRGKYAILPILAWIGLWSYLISPQSVSYEQLRFFIPLMAWLVLSPRKDTYWWIFGLGTVLVSWGAFILTKVFPFVPMIDEIRLLYYGLWLVCLLFIPNIFRIPEIDTTFPPNSQYGTN
ncbi:MAG: hypothetical protein CVU39_21135 [Chloroflexi bacterium HGW-Chloroflexi-10]|nr:MAG: hypothetical protein CVU39_21135 [Chloroflexi bacterium HGW-Chloroflexi-10]